MANLQAIPPRSDRVWREMIINENLPSPRLLALKFLLTRIKQNVKRSTDVGVMEQSIDELRGFFIKNPKLVEEDMSNLLR